MEQFEAACRAICRMESMDKFSKKQREKGLDDKFVDENWRTYLPRVATYYNDFLERQQYATLHLHNGLHSY